MISCRLQLLAIASFMAATTTFVALVAGQQQQTYAQLNAQLLGAQLKLSPAQTLDFLRTMQQVAPSGQQKRQLETLLQLSLHGDHNCQLDYFMDIKSALEDYGSINIESNLSQYLKFHKEQQFALCKAALERSVAELGQDANVMNELAQFVMNAGPGVDFLTLTIPRQNLPIGFANFLKSRASDQSKQLIGNKVAFAQLFLKSIGELCGRVYLRVAPVTEVYKVGNSFREIFKVDSIDQFIWSWMFNMQVCAEATGPWILEAVYNELGKN